MHPTNPDIFPKTLFSPSIIGHIVCCFITSDLRVRFELLRVAVIFQIPGLIVWYFFTQFCCFLNVGFQLSFISVLQLLNAIERCSLAFSQHQFGLWLLLLREFHILRLYPWTLQFKLFVFRFFIIKLYWILLVIYVIWWFLWSFAHFQLWVPDSPHILLFTSETHCFYGEPWLKLLHLLPHPITWIFSTISIVFWQMWLKGLLSWALSFQREAVPFPH